MRWIVSEPWADIGFDGPMRPDHVPTTVRENTSNPGYHTDGRLFAVGYMRGLLEGVERDDGDDADHSEDDVSDHGGDVGSA